MDKALLDTDMFSEVMKGKNPIVASRAATYRDIHGKFTTSALVVTEIVRGYRRVGRDHRIAEFLALLLTEEVLSFDAETAELAGRISGDLDRAGLPIGRIDPLIAATAIRHDLTFATGNARHFDRVRGLGYPIRLADWRQPPVASETGGS